MPNRDLRLPGALLLLALAASHAATAQSPPLSGEVVDSRGRPVAGASVRLRGAGETEALTDASGRFALPAAPREGAVLRVEAPGFAAAERRISGSEERLRIALTPLFSEVVSVSARTARRLADSPSSVVVVSAADLESSPTAPIDEILRRVPGFTLFRRSDSRTANPTAQGVSLRGVGGSGASRAAVLDDGVPVTDPFGGWVAWGRVPRAALERIEVLRGGASDLYGGAALAGAISLVRRPTSEPAVWLDASQGSRGTTDLSLFAAGRRGPWSGSAAGDLFRTDGYVPVAERERGPVDRRADSRHETAELTLERTLGDGGGRVFVRGSSFGERRQNGTALQENDTNLRQVTAGGEWAVAEGTASLRLYAGRQTYHQTFSAVSDDRSEEFLTRRQRVPSRYAGTSGQLSRAFGPHFLIAGVEARQVRGASEEEIVARGGAVTPADSGGRERSGSAFVSDVFSAGSRAVVVGSIRFDVWRSFEGFRTSGAARTELSDRSETAWSPRLSALYRLGGGASVTASAYRSFRAPTLNELYRSFRLGDTLTLANEALRPEVASGGEAGATWTSPDARASARAAVFWMEVDRTIANVTLSSVPGLTTRQRQNLGRTRSRGLELDAGLPLARDTVLEASYLFADSVVRRFPADPSLEGTRVPQVPRHQGSVRIRSAFGRATAVLEARAIGRQFEDDRNRLALSGYMVLGAFLSVRASRAVELFAAGENLLDRSYEAGRTPAVTLGAPRFLRTGLRLTLR